MDKKQVKTNDGIPLTVSRIPYRNIKTLVGLCNPANFKVVAKKTISVESSSALRSILTDKSIKDIEEVKLENIDIASFTKAREDAVRELDKTMVAVKAQKLRISEAQGDIKELRKKLNAFISNAEELDIREEDAVRQLRKCRARELVVIKTVELLQEAKDAEALAKKARDEANLSIMEVRRIND